MLSPRQERFVEEYLKDLNQTQAAIRAGYSAKGASVRGSQLLALRKVAEAVAERKAKLSKTAEMDAAEWRARVAQAARADIRCVTDPETGALLPLQDLDDLGAAAIAGVKVRRLRSRIKAEGETVEEFTVEVKLTDRLRALELYGKHAGYTKERVQLDGAVPLFALPPGVTVDIGGPKPAPSSPPPVSKE